MKTIYVNRTQKDYSLSLKLQIVQSIEKGEHSQHPKPLLHSQIKHYIFKETKENKLVYAFYKKKLHIPECKFNQPPTYTQPHVYWLVL